MIEQLQSVMRAHAISILNEGETWVVFNKADGSKRKMLATRNYDLIPQEHHPKEAVADDVLTPPAPPKAENTEIVKCFDLESIGWRSFRVDSLIDIAAQE